MAEQRVTAWDGLDGTDCRFCGTSYEACSAGVVRDRNDPQASDGCCTDCLDASGHEVSPHVLMSWNGEVEMDSGTEDKVAIHRQRPAGGPITPPPNPLLAATGSYIDRGESEPGPDPQRVTDQLAAWEKWALGGPPGDYASHAILALIADLRAACAREAAERTLRGHAERMKREIRAERDGLQQRIDKALAELAGLEAAARYAAVPGQARYATGVHDAFGQALRTARAALTGTDTGHRTH